MLKTLLMVSLTVSRLALAADAPVAPSPIPADAEQQLREALQVAVSRLAISGALGSHPDQLALSVDSSAQRVNDLGLLVDSSSAERARDGLRALGATPGGSADRMGLRAGDLIVSVNGTSLRALGADARGRALAATTLKAVVDAIPDAGSLRMEVDRAGNRLELQTALRSVKLPAVHLDLRGAANMAAGIAASGSGCGRVSTFEAAPLAKQLYPARVIEIDGAQPASSAQEIFKLDAGKHVVSFAENIPNEQIGVGEFAQMRRSGSKTLSIEVKPGVTSMVAAEYRPPKRGDTAANAYWEPVVWNEASETCP